jgi:hypothetical protein
MARPDPSRQGHLPPLDADRDLFGELARRLLNRLRRAAKKKKSFCFR